MQLVVVHHPIPTEIAMQVQQAILTAWRLEVLCHLTFYEEDSIPPFTATSFDLLAGGNRRMA